MKRKKENREENNRNKENFGKQHLLVKIPGFETDPYFPIVDQKRQSTQRHSLKRSFLSFGKGQEMESECDCFSKTSA